MLPSPGGHCIHVAPGLATHLGELGHPYLVQRTEAKCLGCWLAADLGMLLYSVFLWQQEWAFSWRYMEIWSKDKIYRKAGVQFYHQGILTPSHRGALYWQWGQCLGVSYLDE